VEELEALEDPREKYRLALDTAFGCHLEEVKVLMALMLSDRGVPTTARDLDATGKVDCVNLWTHILSSKGTVLIATKGEGVRMRMVLRGDGSEYHPIQIGGGELYQTGGDHWNAESWEIPTLGQIRTFVVANRLVSSVVAGSLPFWTWGQ